MTDSTRLDIAAATDLAARALMANRTAPKVAQRVAQALVAAEVDGQGGHGLSRVPSYSAQTRSGKVDGFAEPVATKLSAAAVRVDAALGFAYPAVDLAIDEVAALAQDQAIAVAAVHRSHHVGQVGAHCERLAARGLVALMLGNAPKAIAPWGGNKPRLGTNPIAFAAPMTGGPPLVIDLALSKVARGKVMAAQKAGTTIPEGWALDPDGNPTTDPDAALAGTMIPIGDAKGAALAMMVEILAACMVGSNLSFEATSLFHGDGEPPNLGQLLIAFNPDTLSGDAFAGRLTDLVAVYAEDGARLPGTRRIAMREKGAAEGILVPQHLFDEISALADR